MKLRELLSGVLLRGRTPDLEMEIFSITTDSRQVRPGALFGALAGEKADGHQYIPDALDKGAAAVLCQTPPEEFGT